MKNQVLPLRFSPDALAPAISAETLAFHHGKHLPAYVASLQKEIGDAASSEDDAIESLCASTPDNPDGHPIAGQVFNHNLYFSQLCPPNRRTHPSAALLAAIERQYHSFDSFLSEVVSRSVSLFGSGWLWVSLDEDKNDVVLQPLPNGRTPLSLGRFVPLLCVDVWEHAYYLDYQNRRADYVKALLSIIDWDVVSSRFENKKY